MQFELDWYSSVDRMTRYSSVFCPCPLTSPILTSVSFAVVLLLSLCVLIWKLILFKKKKKKASSRISFLNWFLEVRSEECSHCNYITGFCQNIKKTKKQKTKPNTCSSYLLPSQLSLPVKVKNSFMVTSCLFQIIYWRSDISLYAVWWYSN